MAEEQDYVCFVCRKLPPSGRLCVDHQHVKGWSRMPSSDRKNFVRGLLCSYCNFRLLPKGVTLEKSRRVTEYLQRFSDKTSGS